MYVAQKLHNFHTMRILLENIFITFSEFLISYCSISSWPRRLNCILGLTKTAKIWNNSLNIDNIVYFTFFPLAFPLLLIIMHPYYFVPSNRVETAHWRFIEFNLPFWFYTSDICRFYAWWTTHFETHKRWLNAIIKFSYKMTTRPYIWIVKAINEGGLFNYLPI